MKALAVLFWAASAACAVLAVMHFDDMREQASVAKAAALCAELNTMAMRRPPPMALEVCRVPNPIPALAVWAGGFWAVLLALLGVLPWTMARQEEELRRLRLRLDAQEGGAEELRQRVRGLSADAIAAADRVVRR